MYKGSRKRGKGREENRIRKESKNDQKATRRRPEGDQKTARKRSKEIRKRPERDQKETTIPHIHIYYGNDIPIGISNVIETKMNENKQK